VKTGLITTDGFRDLLEIGRQKRPDLYDLQADKAPPLVTRDLRFGVAERVRHDGTVETALDERPCAGRPRAEGGGVKAVAIGFLYGFVPGARGSAKRIVTEEFPEAFICASHEVAPEFREYERISTAVVNAYLGPVMQGYIQRLAAASLTSASPAPHLTQSNGGVIGFDMAARLPVRTVLSGPSTGVVAAQARRDDRHARPHHLRHGRHLLDVALLDAARPSCLEANVHGYPIKAPMLDIHTVGAGGGSLAYVDSGGLLKVGPRSGRRRSRPGLLRPGNRAHRHRRQRRAPDPEPDASARRAHADRPGPAKQAIGRLADELGLDLMATAQGIISVVTANMAKAIRVISVQRGHDPRDYALVAFRRRRAVACRTACARWT
jgi:N-methylhydantoinase A